MNILKSVNAVYRAGYTDYDGLDTFSVFPSRNIPLDALDPFLFLNHHGYQVYEPGNSGLPFGPHPHKGFETVTFIVEGDLVHKDSTGYSSNIRDGGIQWMTAGKGIIHSETSSEKFLQKGGPIEILQLWINLPSRLKNTPPHYIGLQKPELPEWSVDEDRVAITLVSGEWDGRKGPVPSLTDVTMATIRFKRDGALQVAVPQGKRVLFYVIRGKLNVNGSEAIMHELVEFGNEEGAIEVKASEDSLLLFGYASPTGEPIAASGPFVMNTQEEIRQAFVEYHEGKMGVWKH
jgi:redox-sensitive bicupin YhaK (pirin superfamily)